MEVDNECEADCAQDNHRDHNGCQAECAQDNHRDHFDTHRSFFDQEQEAMRLQNLEQDDHQGELLVNQKLQLDLDQDNRLQHNEKRQCLPHVITIQRAWRAYKSKEYCESNSETSSETVSAQSLEDLSETESSNGGQAMSVSSGEGSSDAQLCFGGPPDSLIGSQLPACYPGISPSFNKAVIESEPDSHVSDYSEMADSIKEHLANVRIVQKEDLDTGNTMFADQFGDSANTNSSDQFVVQQKTPRLTNETDDQYQKRLKKMNYLSLAQEFAELKKLDADALPFDLHKQRPSEEDLLSPMSESSETESERCDSVSTTPLETDKPLLADNSFSQTIPNIPIDDNDNVRAFTNTSKIDTTDKDMTVIGNNVTDNKHITDNRPNVTDDTRNVMAVDDRLSATPGEYQDITDVNNTGTAKETESHLGCEVSNPKRSPNARRSGANRSNKTKLSANNDTTNPENVDPRHPKGTCNTGALREQPTSRKSPCRSASKSPAKSSTSDRPTSNESLGDFDVYNIETTLPEMNWAKLEEELTRAAEEERQKKSRRTDREEIRRKLAMAPEEDYYCGERMFKRPNLQTRLQSGMNLQICFMNETLADPDGGAASAAEKASGKQPQTSELKQIQPPPKVPSQSHQPESSASGSKVKGKNEEDEDFFAKQAKLQAEARMALAQVRPMAHMQLEVEKQMRKKSPIAEIVGIPGFGDGKCRKTSKQVLLDMNLAQLQVVVNDLHSQIENLNEDLVKMLVERDDLHMEQDSMLVDIDDFTRRAQEFAAKVNYRKSREKKSCTSK